LLNAIQPQSGWRKLGNLSAAFCSNLHFQNLGTNQAADCAVIHGEDPIGQPVPPVVVVAVVNADHDLHLGLPPETRYFSGMAASPLSHESRDKIRDVLASVLNSARRFGLLILNPMEGLKLPAERTGKRRSKPYLMPAQFEQLLSTIAEP